MIVPRLIVFDLDTTLWYPEMYELSGPPFKKDKKEGRIYDSEGTEVFLFKAVYEIFKFISTNVAFKDTQIAVASRTSCPKWAKECLRLFDINVAMDNGKEFRTLESFIHHRIMMDESKKLHFKQLHDRSGIEYNDMLFFDNEWGNIRTVSSLGVTAIYCPEGLEMRYWEKGLEEYRKAKEKTC